MYLTREEHEDLRNTQEIIPEQGNLHEQETLSNPEHLNRIDLRCIFKYLLTGQDLPPKLTANWLQRTFTIYENKLHLFKPITSSAIGDSPTTATSCSILPVLERGELEKEIGIVHES